jgi:hypothetical protein
MTASLAPRVCGEVPETGGWAWRQSHAVAAGGSSPGSCLARRCCEPRYESPIHFGGGDRACASPAARRAPGEVT